MFKNFYKFLVSVKFDTMDLFELVGIARENGKVYDGTNFTDTMNSPVILDDNVCRISGWCLGTPLFIAPNQYDDATGISELASTHYLFYRDLFFEFIHEPKTDNKIVRVHVKRPDDDWTFSADSSYPYGCRFFEPTNVNTEVYINYDVDVLGVTRCWGRKYKSGTWNKAVYKEFSDLVKDVHAFKTTNQVEEGYQK